MSNPHNTQAIQILERFRQMNAETGWQHSVSKQDTKLEQKTYSNCPFPAYRVTTKINKPKDVVVNKIWQVNEAGAKKNDPKVVMWRLLEEKESYKVIEQYNGMPWPIWHRQVVFAQNRFDDGNKTYLVAFSVDHPSAPVQKATHVLTSLHMSVYEYVDNGDGTTNVTRITQVDPNGSIPVTLVTAFSDGLVDMFNMWKNE